MRSLNLWSQRRTWRNVSCTCGARPGSFEIGREVDVDVKVLLGFAIAEAIGAIAADGDQVAGREHFVLVDRVVEFV